MSDAHLLDILNLPKLRLDAALDGLGDKRLIEVEPDASLWAGDFEQTFYLLSAKGRRFAVDGTVT